MATFDGVVIFFQAGLLVFQFVMHVCARILHMAPPGDESGVGLKLSFLEAGPCQQRSWLKAWRYRSFQG